MEKIRTNLKDILNKKNLLQLQKNHYYKIVPKVLIEVFVNLYTMNIPFKYKRKNRIASLLGLVTPTDFYIIYLNSRKIILDFLC